MKKHSVLSNLIPAAAVLALFASSASGVTAPNAASSDSSSPAQYSNTVTITNGKAVAQLKESGQYDSLSAAYEGARHAVQSVGAPSGDVLKAQNPGHGLSATFDRHGLQLSVRRHGSAGELLTTRWRLASVGRGDVLNEVPAGDELRRDGQRAEIVRAGLGLTEWFVNRPSGLEHGFTLDQRPAGEGELRLALAIEGDLTPVPSADGQRIELNDASGIKVLDYDKLRVWDATGKELPARMGRDATGGLSFRVEDADASYPITVDPTFTQQAYLKASNAGEGDRFGASIAISEDTFVVGARDENGDSASTAANPNDNADRPGAAYVFTRSGTTWTQQAYLKASNAGDRDRFGFSVAISGDTIVVGADLEDGDAISTTASPNNSGTQVGAAYVFTRSGTTWTQQAYLKASNAGDGDNFGTSVAITGDTIVVGADLEGGDTSSTAASPNDNAFAAGAAYVFTRSGTTWTQQAYLKASNAGTGDVFGEAVAVYGDTIVVGATEEAGDAASTVASSNDNAIRAGAAYVFTRSGTTWTQQVYLKASNAGTGDAFGEAVAISGDTIVVSADEESGDASSTAASPNDNAESAGAAYVFIRSGTTWTQQAYLKASNAGTRDYLAHSVAISGDTIVLGADEEAGDAGSTAASSNNNADLAGAAYVFTRIGTTWTQQAYLKASNAGTGDIFGDSVAISGDTIVVGADEEDGDAGSSAASPNNNADDAGAVYVINLLPQSLENLTGLWEFDDPSNPAKATCGEDLVFEGTAPTFSASLADDSGSSLTGIITTAAANNANRIRVDHGIAPNGGGAAVNQFTIVTDIFSPAASRSSWRTILQANGSNANDGDYQIRPEDTIGIGFLGYSPNPIDETSWKRLVVTFDLTKTGGDVIAYLDGALHHTHAGDAAIDSRFALDPLIYAFTDDNGDDTPLNVGTLAIYEGALTPDAVAALGTAGTPILILAPKPTEPFRITEFIYVPTQTIEVTFNSVEGVNYFLEISSDLDQWSTLPGGPYPADVGTSTTINYPAGQTPPESLFFRVRSAP